MVQRYKFYCKLYHFSLFLLTLFFRLAIICFDYVCLSTKYEVWSIKFENEFEQDNFASYDDFLVATKTWLEEQARNYLQANSDDIILPFSSEKKVYTDTIWNELEKYINN